jgi:hypothetical protein
MKKTIITAAVLFACAVAQAATDSATYKVTSDGQTKFQSKISVSDLNTPQTISQQSKTDYVMACSGAVVTQGSVSTGTSIVLNRPDAIKAEDANLVNVTLSQSELKSLYPVETAKCTVQLPDVRGFTASVNVALAVGAKHQIAKDSETGEKWFIERTQ